jgi:NAD(P)H-dependent FMN reductase
MPKLMIVIASVRKGRAGLPIANWFIERAKEHGGFELDVADLAEIALPMHDEPAHPRTKKYEQPWTKAWSERVTAADAFVFVTPEYNFSSPPALVNALDYLFSEWGYKAAGFVSYGGASGGLRSVQMTKLLVTTLKMVPLTEAVSIPFFSQQLADGVFTGNDAQAKSAKTMLDELARWNGALATLRA